MFKSKRIFNFVVFLLVIFSLNGFMVLAQEPTPHQLDGQDVVQDEPTPSSLHASKVEKTAGDDHDYYLNIMYRIKSDGVRAMERGGEESSISRGDAMRALIIALESEGFHKSCNTSNPFPDVDENTDNYEYICKAKRWRIVGGYSDGLFRPDESITRCQMAVVASNTLDRVFKQEPDLDEGESFPDVPKGHGCYEFVQRGYEQGLYRGYSDDGTFQHHNDSEPTNKGEAAIILGRTVLELPDFEVGSYTCESANADGTLNPNTNYACTVTFENNAKRDGNRGQIYPPNTKAKNFFEFELSFNGATNGTTIKPKSQQFDERDFNDRTWDVTINFTTGNAGTYQLCAEIDSSNRIVEGDKRGNYESNNDDCFDITVGKDAEVTVSPESAQQNEPFTIKGEGFDGFSDVKLFLTSLDSGETKDLPVDTGTEIKTDEDGNFTYTWKPDCNVPVGKYKIGAEDEQEIQDTSDEFEIAAGATDCNCVADIVTALDPLVIQVGEPFDVSNATDDHVTTWTWLHNGNTFNDKEQKFRYDESGTFQVDLTTTCQNGLSHTDSIDVIVEAKPLVASFEFLYPDENGKPIAGSIPGPIDLFLKNTSPKLEDIDEFEWRVDGNLISREMHASFNFEPGEHTVTLIVTDTDRAENNSATELETIVIDTEPKPIIAEGYLGPASVKIGWNVTNDTRVKEYIVCRQTAGQGSALLPNVSQAKPPSHVDTDVQLGNSYTYTVIAVREGESNTECDMPNDPRLKSNPVPMTYDGSSTLWSGGIKESDGGLAIIKFKLPNGEGLRLAHGSICFEVDGNIIDINSLIDPDLNPPQDLGSQYGVSIPEQYQMAWQTGSGTNQYPMDLGNGIYRVAVTINPPTDTHPAITGDGDLLHIKANFVNPDFESTPITLVDYDGMDCSTEFYPVNSNINTVPLTLMSNNLINERRGDPSKDGKVRPNDVYLALAYTVPDPCPNPPCKTVAISRLAADMNNNGKIDPSDAVAIRYYNLYRSLPIKAINQKVLARSNETPMTFKLDDVGGESGANVETTLHVENISDVTALYFVIVYDKNMIAEISNVSVAGLATDSDVVFSNMDGLLYISLANLTSSIAPYEGSGALATLSLRLADGASNINSGALRIMQIEPYNLYGEDVVRTLGRTVETHDAKVTRTDMPENPLGRTDATLTITVDVPNTSQITFDGYNDFGDFALRHGESRTFKYLTSNHVYTVTKTLPTDLSLLSIECDNGIAISNSGNTTTINSIGIDLNAGDDVICTYGFSKPGSGDDGTGTWATDWTATFAGGDQELCQHEPGWINTTLTVKPIPAGSKGYLQTDWYVVGDYPSTCPADDANCMDSHYQSQLIEGETTIQLRAWWPGIYAEDGVVENHFSANLLDENHHVIHDGIGQDFYWYPWVCNAPDPSPGSIKIVKESNPQTGQSFDFAGDLGAFSLYQGMAESFSDLTAGTYDVSESNRTLLAADDWSLLSVTCREQHGYHVPPQTHLANFSAMINMKSRQDLTCTFLNEKVYLEGDIYVIYLPSILR